MKKVSIITVSYNCEKTLLDTINSVSNQTVRNAIEYIIIDGQSTDATLDIIKENEHLIDHWISDKDNGIYDAMNKGLQCAQGEWVGFLHADDLFHNNNVIESIINEINNSDFNCLYGNLNYIQEEPPHKIVRHWKSQAFSDKLLKRGWMPPHPTVYLKRSHLKELGLFNTNYIIAADYDYMLRTFSHENTQSTFLDQVLIDMRLGGVSNNSLKNIIQKSKEDYKALKSNKVGGLYALFIKNFSKLIQFF
ncbi:MAG: glycosyltransferase [Carboxylicivirga sp.]|jgi:glycosyltransferase|nr:glycosyltransferase [Carboxylicivirga sp.]